MKKNIFYFVFALVFVQPLFSQDKKVNIEISKELQIMSSGTMGSNSAFVELFNPKPVKKNLVVTFNVYDQALGQKNTVDANVSIGSQHKITHADSLGIYTIYAKALSGDFSFLWYNGTDVKTISGTFGAKTYCNQIVSNGSNAIVVANGKDDNDFIITADFNTGKSTPVFLNKTNTKADVKISSFVYNKQFNEFYLVYTLKQKKDWKLCAVIIDKNLEVSEPMVISSSIGDDKFLMSASFNPVAAGEFIITGTYQNEEGDYANGMYIGRWKNSAMGTIKYYSFATDFTHFNDYLSDKQKAKTENKKDRAESKGKEFNLDVLMITHSLLNLKGVYVLIGEIYVPEYTTYTDSKGITTTVFDGYRYPQAIIVGFNDSFEKMWDNSFAIGEMGGFIPEEIVHVQNNADNVFLFFNNGTTIQSIKFNSTGAIDEDRKTRSYEVADDGNSVTAAYGGAIEYWFENFFLATGIVKEKGDDGKKVIFYLQKISLTDK